MHIILKIYALELSKFEYYLDLWKHERVAVCTHVKLRSLNMVVHAPSLAYLGEIDG